MDLEALTDDELDAHRREVLAERERRQKLTDGLAEIGRLVCDYASAARIDPPDGEHGAIGQAAVDAVTGGAPDGGDTEPEQEG